MAIKTERGQRKSFQCKNRPKHFNHSEDTGTATLIFSIYETPKDTLTYNMMLKLLYVM